MESGYAQPWFYGMSQAVSISRNHPYTTHVWHPPSRGRPRQPMLRALLASWVLSQGVVQGCQGTGEPVVCEGVRGSRGSGSPCGCVDEHTRPCGCEAM